MRVFWEPISGSNNKAVKDKSVGQERLNRCSPDYSGKGNWQRGRLSRRCRLETDEKEEADYRAKTVFDSISAKDKQTQELN